MHRQTISYKVPEPTLRRLPWYLAYTQMIQRQGEEFISSTQMAMNIDIDASKVAKDLSYVQVTGRTRVGYNVDELVDELERFLGFTHTHKAYLFGVGNLGGALLHDNGLDHFGLHIEAGFDIKHELSGTSINKIPIHHLDRFSDLQNKSKIEIGVLTVPTKNAQSIADAMIAGGIKAIWNFTPFRVKVPDDIVVQNTSIYAHLAVMFNRLSELNEGRK